MSAELALSGCYALGFASGEEVPQLLFWQYFASSLPFFA
jgi:hypothetical protein